MLEMYKLYQFAMPSTAKAKNLFLITQNLDKYLLFSHSWTTQGLESTC